MLKRVRMRTGGVLSRLMVWGRFVISFGGAIGSRFMVGNRLMVRCGFVIWSWLVIGSGFMIGSWFVIRSWFVVRGRFMVRGRFVVGSRLVEWLWSITLPSRSTLDIFLEVTGSQVLIKNGPIAAVKGILFSIFMAEMVNLTVSFGISIVPSGIWYRSAVKAGICLRHCNMKWLHRLHLIWSLLQENRANGLVVDWFRRAIGRGGGAVGWFRFMIGRLRGVGRLVRSVWFRSMVCWCWRLVWWFRMISWLWMVGWLWM